MRKFLFFVLVMFPVAVAVSLYAAFVAVHLWDWFVAPQMGVAQMRFWNAAGIAILFGVYRLWPSKADMWAEWQENEAGVDFWKKAGRWGAHVFVYAVMVSMSLGTGWVYHRLGQ